MPVNRGTLIILTNGSGCPVCKYGAAIAGDVGKVSSRKKNGWLRVTLERTGKTISVRNIAGEIELFYKIELRSLSPLQRLEDAAVVLPNQECEDPVNSEYDMCEMSVVPKISPVDKNLLTNIRLKQHNFEMQNTVDKLLERVNGLELLLDQHKRVNDVGRSLSM